VVAVHERLLAVYGGAAGLRDEGLLEAALAAPKNRLAYEGADIARLAAAYAHAITRNHPFMDGNKRVALTVAGVFLELNGFRLEASEQDAAQATRALAAGEIGESRFAGWLRAWSSEVHPRRCPTTPGPTRRSGRRPKRK
jgi:death-on-curing protein